MSYMIVLVKEDDNWCLMIVIFSDSVKKAIGVRRDLLVPTLFDFTDQ